MPEWAAPFGRLAVALLVGFLIGLDRERAEERKKRELFAGVRTVPLIALAGAVPALIGGTAGMVLLAASALIIGGITVVAYVRELKSGHPGATTELAVVAAFLLGALAGSGQWALAGVTGVAVSALLAAKPRLEGFSRALTAEEVTAALKLAVITVIVLPLLPDRTWDPWAALNPREIWIVVVLVSGLSFAGFAAVRLLGEQRGLLLTGAFGGLASSTAVTMAMAERSRTSTPARQLSAAATLGSVVMAIRMTVLAGGVDPRILAGLAPVTGAMVVAGGLAAWLLARGAGSTPAGRGAGLRNPFSLRHALVFALIYAGVRLGAEVGRRYLGAGGLYITAALSGIADVDAITVAATRQGPLDGSWHAPVLAIAIAAIVNSLVKAGMAIGFGAGPFRMQTAAGLAAMAAAAGAAAVASAAG